MWKFVLFFAMWCGGQVWGQDCARIRPILLCNDLCSESLEHPRVQEVRFSGVLASFQCVPASVKVGEKPNIHI